MQMGAFVPILNAYSEMERSDYEIFDEALIGDTGFVYVGRVHIKNEETPPSLLCALYDVNSDGQAELFVKLDDSHFTPEIYALQEGKPVLIAPEEDFGYFKYFHLLMDEEGHPVIEYARGRMDVAAEFFFAIDENSRLVALDKLYTNGRDRTTDEYILFRTKEVDGAQVDIAEEEYLSLLRKYGSGGYGTYLPENSIREIALDWNPVATAPR
jgi:hypothetical protein